MAILKPFRAWRPKPEFVSDIACLPYDVVHTDEARSIIESQKNSFMKVIRPEADFDEPVSSYAEEVYAKGRANLKTFLDSSFFEQDLAETFYVYRLQWHDKVKTGIFGCVTVEDYDNGVILKHELTRPIKEDDRTKHIVTQEAHAEPVMLTFESNDLIREILTRTTQNQPLYQFMVDDEVEHSIWKLDQIDTIVEEFGKINHLYVADGHHRCASASRAAKETDTKKHPSVLNFPAVLFPIDEVQILSYNRIIMNVDDQFITNLSKKFEVSENVSPVPEESGKVRFYFKGVWYGLEIPTSKLSDIESQLDVARLQEFVLDPFFGITDQRTDQNISFVGGVHGIEELEKKVDSGVADLAISMYPTSIEELIAVSDAGLLMPPKSTWFEPKLRSGLLIHTF
jgi:uncharacterized protein (DUF1015 family)